MANQVELRNNPEIRNQLSIPLVTGVDYPGESCSICIEMFVDSKLKEEKGRCYTPCRHKFHCECFGNWLEEAYICPCCREDLNHYTVIDP